VDESLAIFETPETDLYLAVHDLSNDRRTYWVFENDSFISKHVFHIEAGKLIKTDNMREVWGTNKIIGKIIGIHSVNWLDPPEDINYHEIIDNYYYTYDRYSLDCNFASDFHGNYGLFDHQGNLHTVLRVNIGTK
jgi:hypothetical protein